MKTSVDISLGYAPEIYQLFSYSNPVVPLTDVISHAFNQTLERDMFWGSWADAYVKKGGEYRIKLTSPNHDLTRYTKLIPAYLAAGRLALKAFNSKVTNATGLQFLLPFGLAMANVRSVQLFHFPPSEISSYTDYLYSPTNRRWEALLIENGFDGRDRTLVERIIDLVPIAADGGAGKQIDEYNSDYTDYVRAQLNTFLGGHRTHTPPLVGMGAPVRDWFREEFGVKQTLKPLSLIEMEIVKGRKTPILFANHPSQYLYDTDEPVTGGEDTLTHDVRREEGKKSAAATKSPATKASAAKTSATKTSSTKSPAKTSSTTTSSTSSSSSSSSSDTYASPYTVMQQDLVSAGWQAAMSKDWGADPKQVLSEVKKRWTEDEVKRVMRSQNQEFSYAK